jgi:hypothetical protein
MIAAASMDDAIGRENGACWGIVAAEWRAHTQVGP